MKIFICANLNKEKTITVFPEVVRALRLYGITPFVEKRFEDICSGLSIDGIIFGTAQYNAENCDIFL